MLLVLPASSRAAGPEPTLAERYRLDAARIIGEATLSNHAYEVLGYLCDNIGHRLSGSPELDRAIVWAQEQMRRDGLANVRAEAVKVPAWVRGHEEAEVLAPTRHHLNILGLGNSVGTPPGGITAEVVVVGSFDELEALGTQGVAGKIVLYDVPYTGYGNTVRYRGSGPSRAAALGAVAALVRSVGPMSYDTPHTGMLRYTDGVPQIPAAAVTIEAATMLHRMQDRGDRPRVRLMMEAHSLEDAVSANVIAEVPGSELPEEVIVIGGHLDSWDVGQGAQDDGAGCVIAMEAARLIHALDLKPRRTVRVVLFTNEENGLRGGRAYLDAHRQDLANHVAAIESDSGNGLASGFEFELRVPFPADTTDAARADARQRMAAARERTQAILDDIGTLLAPLGGGTMKVGGSGADIGPMVRAGVPGLGLNHDTTKYFEIHHTHADTFEKIIPEDLARNVAIMAVMTYVLADMPGHLDPGASLTRVAGSE
jgi:carboxypeptidase Q